MTKHTHLEAVRGLAALIVVFTHFFAAFHPAAVYGSAYPAQAPWESFFTHTPLGLLLASHFAVAVFFVLSGYVLSVKFFGPGARDNRHLFAAVIKRPFRLGGLVVFSVVLSFCVGHAHGYFNAAAAEVSRSVPWFRDAIGRNIPGFQQLLSDLVIRPFASGATYNPVLWTIQIELYGSFLTFAFVFLFRTSRLRFIAYPVAAVCLRHDAYLAFIVGIFYADVQRNYPTLLARWFRPPLPWVLLVAGLLLASCPEHIASSGQANAFRKLFPPLPFIGWGYPMLGAVLVLPAVLVNPRLQQFLSAPAFAFLGRVSYALYAIHSIFLASVSAWLFLKLQPHLGHQPAFLIVFPSSLAVIFLISHWISRCVDQPVINLANSLARFVMEKISPSAPPLPPV